MAKNANNIILPLTMPSKIFYQLLIVAFLLTTSIGLTQHAILYFDFISYEYYNQIRILEISNLTTKLISTILLLIYFGKANHKVMRNLMILLLISGVLAGLISSGPQSNYFGISDDRLNKILICIELSFYLSFIFSNTRHKPLLKYYGIVMSITLTINTLFHVFSLNSFLLYNILIHEISYILLILHFIREMKQLRKPEPDILD